MKHRPHLHWTVLLGVFLVGLLLAACSGGPATPPPTHLPTATPTPRSTPLPPVPTAVPAGSEGNPLTILMLPQGSRRAAVRAAGNLEDMIQELTGLVVDIQTVNSYGEIVAQLCSPVPVAGWVDGLSYIVAEAQGCADPALRVERDGNSGYRVDLLVSTDLADGGDSEGDVSGIEIAALDGEPFCRLNSEDTVSWLVPGLMLYAGGVNPLYDLGEIVDVQDFDALITAIYQGDCMAGAVPHNYYPNEISPEMEALEDLSTRIGVLQTSPEIPYDTLVFSRTLPLNVRIPLADVFMQIAADEDNAATLATILRQDALERVDAEDFADFRAFMNATGLDFAALGE